MTTTCDGIALFAVSGLKPSRIFVLRIAATVAISAAAAKTGMRIPSILGSNALKGDEEEPSPFPPPPPPFSLSSGPTCPIPRSLAEAEYHTSRAITSSSAKRVRAGRGRARDRSAISRPSFLFLYGDAMLRCRDASGEAEAAASVDVAGPPR